MATRGISRRKLLRGAAAGLGVALLAACKPETIEKVVKETVEVEKIVKETIVVTEEVEKEVTRVVEKQVTTEVIKVVEKPKVAFATGGDFLDQRWEADDVKGVPFEDLNAWMGTTYQVREVIDAKYDAVYMDWGWAEALDQKQRAALAAGNVPCLFYGEVFMPDYANSGLLEPLPDDIVEKIHPKFVLRGKDDGVAYGIARNGLAFLLMYNEDLINNVGLDGSKPPTTWDEWLDMSNAISAEGKGEFYGGGVACHPHSGGALRTAPILRSNFGDFGADGRPTINTPQNVEAFEFIRAMAPNGPVEQITAADEGPLNTAFFAGKTGFMYGVSGDVQRARTQQGNPFNASLTPIPVAPDGQAASIMLGVTFFAVPKQAPNIEAGMDFIRAMVNAVEGSRKFIEMGWATGVKEAYYDAEARKKAPPQTEVMLDLIDTGNAEPLPSFAKNSAQVWDVIHQTLVKVCISKDAVKDILDEAQKEAESYLV